MSFVDDSRTKLLTLLNVSATKPGKRKRSGEAYRSAPLGGKRSASAISDRLYEAAAVVAAHQKQKQQEPSKSSLAEGGATARQPATFAKGELEITAANDSDDEEAGATASSSHATSSSVPLDAFALHFASEGERVLAKFAEELKSGSELKWEQAVNHRSELGTVVESTANEGPRAEFLAGSSAGPHANVLKSWRDLRVGTKKSSGKRSVTAFQHELISRLSHYQDLYHSSVPIEQRSEARDAIACHAVSHAIKTRRKILRNNEKLAHAAAAGGVDTDVPRDQGFTRPKVLILAPMRNSALEWIHLLESLSGCPQVENKSRLEKEYNLPEDALDKLAQPEARDRYPLDHLETFRGNIDDNFLLGVKLTRKSLKLFSAFYESDFIVASPLALRLAIEKDRDSDFLSSIEVLVADQMDVMTMQNWDHFQFVLEHLNRIPKESHDTDFSRIRQWYLDGKAAYFRQSILLSSYDAPEMRSVFSHNLKNLAGKARTLQDFQHGSGVMSRVREGIRQSFVRFDCANLQAEHELRFQYFTKKTLPNLLKSAMSASKTLIFVPSYFDFVRLEDHMRQEQLSFASISEYSSGRDIARARQQFLSGKRSFLLVTERFHFYRRYVIRGAQTIAFYALPEHSDYFVEALSFPFARTTSLVEALDLQATYPGAGGKSMTFGNGEEEEQEQEQETELDPSDVSVVALFSRYDLLRLQRIVGADVARKMIEEERSTWRFS